ncbi:uncharacterized protein [Diadema antillarum]|uniref:uncharacterized protein n=1 Tax=Diadema antillarum TaxID=105358 RepID=UPI003A889E26
MPRLKKSKKKTKKEMEINQAMVEVEVEEQEETVETEEIILDELQRQSEDQASKQDPQDQIPDYSSVSFMSSEGYLLPCVYRGIPHEHGEEWVINDCSTCVCTNATIECVIKGCPPHECEDAIHPPGACCPMCPFHVNVSRVSPTVKILSTPKILPGRTNKLSLNVSMIFKENKRTTGVHGHNLWNMTVWASENRQGEGFAYSVTKNVLTSDQRAQKYRKGKPFPKFKNIPFNLDATGLTCDDMRFICVRFDQADKPRHENYEYVPFFFGGYPDDYSLTGCVSAPRCKKLKPKLAPPSPTTTAPTTTTPTTTVVATATPTATTASAPTTRPTRRPKLRLTNWPSYVESTSRPEVTQPPSRQPFGDTFTMRSSFVTLMPLSYVGGWPQDSGSNEVVHQSLQTAQNQRGQRGQGGSSGLSGSQSIRRPGRRGSKRKTLSENALAAGLSSNEVEVLLQKRRQQIRRRHRQKQEQEQRMQQRQDESTEQYYQPYSGQQYRQQPQPNWRMQRQYEREQEEYERQRQQYMQQQENYQRQLQQYMLQQQQQQNQRYLQQQQHHQQQQHQAQGYPYGRVRSGQLNPLYQRSIDKAVAEGTLQLSRGRVANNQRQSSHDPMIGMPFDHAYMPPNSEEQ